MGFPKMPPVNYIRQLHMFNEGVPRPVRFWSIVLMAIFYQLAGGVYLASLTQMVGELSCLSEDVTMSGYCSLIGLNIIFPMLFKWKFALYTRQLFFISSITVMVCNIAACFNTIPQFFWVICFVAGYAKMMGMFGCMSSIQLNITPTRNFAVFFPVIYVIVCGSMLKSVMIASESFTDPRMLPAASELLEQQSLLMALKESYGFLILLGILILIAILLCNFQPTFRRVVPKIISVRKWMMKPGGADPTIPVPVKK